MIQFNFLSGNKAGGSWTPRRFPVRIGRLPHADLQLEEQGVWDNHLQIDFIPREGFVASVPSRALTAVNGHPIERAVLRNGDIIQLGAIKLQFWLAESRQSGLRLREWLTWFAIAAISLAQIALIYFLLQE